MSRGRRFAVSIIAAVLLLAGVPFAPASAASTFPLPGAPAGQEDVIRGVYEYDDFDALSQEPEPDLGAVKVDSLEQWDALQRGTKEHMHARWKAYVVEKQAADWNAWRFFYLARNRLNAKDLLNTTEPSAAVIGSLKEAMAYKPGTPERLFARWRDVLDARQDPKWTAPNWASWLTSFIQTYNSGNRGGPSGFEGFFKTEELEKTGLINEHFRFNQQVPAELKAKLPADMITMLRRPDIADFVVHKVIIELKSGGKLGEDQWEQLADLLRIAKATGCDLIYAFGEQPDQATIDKMHKMAREIGAPLAVRHYRAIPQKKSQLAQQDQSRAGPGVLTAPGQYSPDSPITDLIEAAPNTAEEAAERSRIQQSLRETTEDDPEGVNHESQPDLGGVDFSTLELRYVSSAYHNGPGAQYAFKADALPDGQQSFGGKRVAKLVSDSFFVWLALSPDKFWVNLNPDEPNRIIDAKFGRTDAGRVLLEADLAMKKSVAKFIHPDSPGGKKYWDSLRGNAKCVSMRQWIVPDAASVRDTGDELFILETPLQVKMETEYFKTKQTGPAGTDCGAQDAESTRHNEQVYRSQILPQVQEAVNKAPEYADLRRVYASRVAAEWFRLRSISKRTAYSDLVNKGDVSRWESTEKWTPREVFDRYVQSYKNGEFNITRTTTQGNWIYTHTFIYGGVNFERVNRKPVAANDFAREHPNLPAVAKNALHGGTSEGRALWAGGLTTTRPLAEALRAPESATGKPLFYLLAAVPLAGWLAIGLWLGLRRRRGTEVPA